MEQYEGQEVKECYIFKHPTDLFCPVILHFPLVNNKFKEFKAPGECVHKMLSMGMYIGMYIDKVAL